MDSNVKPEAKVAKKKKKVRNPRITVCYSPEDYATILEESTKAGIKKSQYIHDKSLEIMLYQLMNDEQTKALISLLGMPAASLFISTMHSAERLRRSCLATSTMQSS